MILNILSYRLINNKVAWPSGLRRWFKAPVSSEARVRISPLPNTFLLKTNFLYISIFFKKEYLYFNFRLHQYCQESINKQSRRKFRFDSAVRLWLIGFLKKIKSWITYSIYCSQCQFLVIRILFPTPGVEPGPAGWKPAILAVRPRGMYELINIIIPLWLIYCIPRKKLKDVFIFSLMWNKSVCCWSINCFINLFSIISIWTLNMFVCINFH